MKRNVWVGFWIQSATLIACVMIVVTAGAQSKSEREQRIVESDVPELALNWFHEAFPAANTTRWFAEITSGKKSFEAKHKKEGVWYSVEFSEQGLIEDIESEIDWKEVPEELRQNLEYYFEQQFKRYSIRKVQQQWTGSAVSLKLALAQNNASEITTRYEIEFYGVDDDQKALWEGLFSEDGELIQRREIILRPTDNLNY